MLAKITLFYIAYRIISEAIKRVRYTKRCGDAVSCLASRDGYCYAELPVKDFANKQGFVSPVDVYDDNGFIKTILVNKLSKAVIVSQYDISNIIPSIAKEYGTRITDGDAIEGKVCKGTVLCCEKIYVVGKLRGTKFVRRSVVFADSYGNLVSKVSKAHMKSLAYLALDVIIILSFMF